MVNAMALKKSRKSGRPEIMSRYLTVTGWRGHVNIRVDHPRGGTPCREGSAWLEIKGDFLDAVNGVTQASVHVLPSTDVSLGDSTPPSIGAIISIKPSLQIVVNLTGSEFDRVWLLAATNQLRSCFIAFTQPHRRSALVVNLSISSALPEEDEE